MYRLGFRSIQKWDDYDISDKEPFAVSGVCQDYAVHVACHISAMKSFTYVLSLCLFRITTFLVFLYFLVFLWVFGILWYTGFPPLPQFFQLIIMPFAHPDFVTCLYVIYDFYEHQVGLRRLVMKVQSDDSY